MKLVKNSDLRKILEMLTTAENLMDDRYGNGTVPQMNAFHASLNVGYAKIAIKEMLGTPSITYGKKYKSQKKAK